VLYWSEAVGDQLAYYYKFGGSNPDAAGSGRDKIAEKNNLGLL
jgi:hypothetical protein